MKPVKGMKKYSHLFLFVILLNITSTAQNAQPNNQSASVPESLSKTAVTALQSLGKAADAISPAAESANPVAPVSPPAAPAKTEATPVKVAAREAANASPTAITQPLVSGRGIRNPMSKNLKGQTTGDAKIDELIVAAAMRHGVEPLLLYSVMCQESAFNDGAISPKGARGLM